MKKNVSIRLAALLLAFALPSCGAPNSSQSSFSISSDQPSESSSIDSSAQSGEKDEIQKVYDLYVKNVSASGEVPLSYEEWLATIKGEKGDTGPKGDSGASVLTGEGAPLSTKGKDGDSYIDLLTWDFYIKVNGVWAKTGNISGQSSSSPDENPQGLKFYPLDDGTYGVSLDAALYLSEITVPATYRGKEVTRFLCGTPASLHGFSAIAVKKVVLPDTITSVEKEAFYDWDLLESVTIPSGEIGPNAFYGCKKLSNVILGHKVTSIGYYAFSNCASLKELVVPEGVASIGDGAFAGTSLLFLSLPDSLITIDGTLFSSIGGLSSLQTLVQKDGLYYIGNSANPYVYLAGVDNRSMVSAQIAPGCRIVGKRAFAGCYNLRNVVLPSTVVSIGEEPFSECSSLSFIQIPSGVVSIANGAIGNGVTVSFGGTMSEWALLAEFVSAICSDGFYEAPTPPQPAPPAYPDLSNGASITYWCPNTDTDLFAQKVAAFKLLHPEYKGSITQLAILGEGDVRSELSKDAEIAADVFEIADHDVADCVDWRAMTSFGKASEVQWIKDIYGETAVAAVTIKGQVYGLPYRNDNGYVLTYDKAIVSDEQAKTVEGIIAACKAKNAVFGFDLANSWYAFAPVWGAGGKTYTDAEGVFHSEIATDAVAKAVGGFGKIVKDAGSTWVHSDADDKMGVEGAGRVGAVVKWNNYNAEKKALGDNLGVAPLPSFSVDGTSYALKGFQGYKALGMRRAAAFTEEKRIVAVEFAKFMGSDEVSEARLTQLGQGVSNKAVIAKTELWTSPWIAALTKMSSAGNTVSQANGSSGTFWDPAKALGNAIKGGTIINQQSAKEALQLCQQAQMSQ